MKRLIIAGTFLLLGGCSTIDNTLGNISPQNEIDFNASAVAAGDSMQEIINLCGLAPGSTPVISCANYKSQIRAASEALDTLMDNGNSLIQNGGSGEASEIVALLASVASDLLAYETIVSDLNGQAAAKTHNPKLTITEIIDILQIAIPFITNIATDVENALNSGTPTLTAINANVQTVDNNNQIIQTW